MNHLEVTKIDNELHKHPVAAEGTPGMGTHPERQQKVLSAMRKFGRELAKNPRKWIL